MKMRRILSLLLVALMVVSVIVAGGIITAEDVSPYKDVKTSRWSYADIMYVTEKGLMNGTEANKFAPGETMTRAMVVTVLYRLQGEPGVEYTTVFTDVKEGKWYTDAILWAAQNNIVNGVGNNKYDPMGTITREQLATIIMRYAPEEYIVTEERADITGYADYKRVREYARDALSWANAVGLITGKTETTLAPREGATREQFAAILKRFKEYDSYKYEIAYNAPTVYSTYTEKEYPLVTDADIYVATDGNDTNPGTLDKPVKTFARAKEMVRELKATKTTGGIKVAFKAGEYGALDNLTFTPEDAGTAECPITYCKYGDGDVVFRNGLHISENEFKPLDESEKAMFPAEAVGNIYKVDLNGKIDVMNADTLLFGGVGVYIEARFPNQNEDGSDNSYKDFTTRVEEEGKAPREYDKLKLTGVALKVINGFKTTEGLNITGYFRTGWLVDTFATKAYDKSTGILTLDFENSAFKNGYPISDEYCLAVEDRMDDTIFFHNLAEFLDKEGEYWFDKNTKQLYVYAPEGDYAITQGGKFMTLERGTHYLNFVGLEFNTSSAYGIVVNRSNHITFKLCKFANIAGSRALDLQDVTDNLVTECEFTKFVDIGVNLDCGDGKALVISGNNVIDNNYFHDYGMNTYFTSCGIKLRNDVGTIVSHNLFEKAARSAVRYDDCTKVIIEYNVFDRMLMTSEDMGAVYTFHSAVDRDNHIRYNMFINNGQEWSAVYGIYLDDYSCGQKVYGNLFYNGGAHAVTMNMGRDNVVYDNVVINPDGGDFLMINAGAYKCYLEYKETGEDTFVAGHPFYDLIMSARKRVPGTPEYEAWYAVAPEVFDYNFDYDKTETDDPSCVFRTVNYIKNNVAIGNPVRPSTPEMFDLFAVTEGNVDLQLDENPYFVDPTHGDYRIKDDAPIFKIPVEEIGRY